MNPFNMSNFAFLKAQEPLKAVAPNDTLPRIIEGADVYDVLCPVSKRTGHRDNPLSLLMKVLPPDKERLASAILQEIPSIQQENPNVSDADAIDMCVSRFSSGTPFEDDQVRRALFSVADVLFPEATPQEKKASVESPSVDAAQVVDNV